MLVDDMIKQTQVLAENDLTISKNDIVNWFNLGINRININCECAIPTLDTQNTNGVRPQFDERYHEALILFALMKYWESDSSYNEAQYFGRQFEDMVSRMQRDMEIPPSSRKGFDVVQIDVTDVAQNTYTLRIPSSAYYSEIEVYRNGIQLEANEYRITSNTLFILVPLVLNDRLTVLFNERSDMNQPSQSWWSW